MAIKLLSLLCFAQEVEIGFHEKYLFLVQSAIQVERWSISGDSYPNGSQFPSLGKHGVTQGTGRTR
jgi:hypothetical protein